MTVDQLRKKLRGKKGSMQVYIADHDHSEWETNSIAGDVVIVNQKDYKEELDNDTSQPKIKGDYLVIRP